MDDWIDLFLKRFDELKDSFDRGTNVQTWVNVHNMQYDLRQVIATLEEINTSGQISSIHIV
jgi:hypothetical protein